MRLRWITALCALALKLALIAAVLLAGRTILEREYARLEREHVENDLDRVTVVLRSQLADLNVTASDFADWDYTYEYIGHPQAAYVNEVMSSTTFRARHIQVYLLMDRKNKVKLARTNSAASLPTLPADLDQLVRAVKRRTDPAVPVTGLMTLTGGPAMVVMQPVMHSNGDGPSRGVLVMVRGLGPTEIAELSRLSEHEISISGTIGESSETVDDRQLQIASMWTTVLGDNHLRGTAMLNDLWRKPRIRVQIEHNRAIWAEGKQTLRALLVIMAAVGLLFAIANAALMQYVVVGRVEKLIRFASDAEAKDGLSARVKLWGSDELAELGRRLNQMLERLQNSNDKLLGAQERLRYEASHDSLTGLWNRCAAMQLLDQELARCARNGSPVSVIMFDADHFKRINDHFGHTTGDRALQAIAAAITRNLRSFDVCCRYGGEEFMVLAPNCDLKQGTELANRILMQVRNEPVTIPDHAFCVNLSAGVTAGAASCSAEELIMVADRALYRAKEKGRNRVEVEALPDKKRARSSAFAPILDSLKQS
jgi:diguanylate cyclase (GGDEF)-like protein